MKNLFRLTALLSALGTALPVHSAPYATPDTWGGDLATRPRLTGDWGGVRDDLAKKGVVLDVDAYWWPQKITGGGKNTSGGNWGNLNTELNVDTGKAGLWPGGFFKVKTVTGFGHYIGKDIGAILPANAAWSLPASGEEGTGLLEYSFLQLLNPQLGVKLGKMDFSVTPGLFTGDYRTQFANLGLKVPLAAALFPISTFGASVIYAPSPDVTLSFMLLGPSGTVKSDDLSKAFDDGVFAVANGEVQTNLFGFTGNQGLLLYWSDKARTSLVQDPSNIARQLLNEKYPWFGDLSEILGGFAPGLVAPTEPLNMENDTWTAVYSAEQFLWQPSGDPKRGIGVFYSAGVSDGRANPIKYSYTLGLVGKGVVPGRANDDFGIGWSRAEFSDKFVPSLRDTFNLGLNREDAVEMYYKAAVTPWLSVSPSLQIINSGVNKTIDSSGNVKDLDTTYLVGVRVGIRF
jgi:porin